MKQILFFILLLFFNFTGFSQIIFEKGYFINNQNEKVDCLIQNYDWLNNPKQFKYKLTEGAEEQLASIETIKEFGIGVTHKYKRFEVNIDRSSDKLDQLSPEKKPLFSKEVLFLKTLIEGEASLYLYNEKSLLRFFYQIKEEPIQQLIYKRYMHSAGTFKKNTTYHQQLLGYLNCHNASSESIQRISYVKSDLVRHFKSHNECKGVTITDYGKTMNTQQLGLRIRPGIRYTSMSIQNSLSLYHNTKLKKTPSIRLGLEGEIMLPFNKNKWSLIVEPTLQYYQSTTDLEGSVTPFRPAQELSSTYLSLELPVGLRHYFYLNNGSKLFINALAAFDISTKSEINFEQNGARRREDSPVISNFLATGIGYDFKEKYNVELRYQLNRNILRDYLDWSSNFSNISLVFGYKIK